MKKIKEMLTAFMRGRYGADALYRFTVYIAAALILSNIFLRSAIVYLAAAAVIAWAYFRAFSRNIPARRAENAAYLKITSKLTSGIRIMKLRFRDRKTHCYKKCPACRKMLRLPKRKGAHTVKCPQCGNEFNVKI